MTKDSVFDAISAEIEWAKHSSDIDGEGVLIHVVRAVREQLGIACDYEHCGGFDSPGYDIDCYAIAFVTDSGEIGIYDYQIETY